MVDTDVISGSLVSRRDLSGSGTGRRVRSAASSLGWLVLGIVLCIIIWQLIIVFTGVKPVTLPSPLDVTKRTWALRAELWTNMIVTLKAILIGYGLAIVVGVLVAVAVAFSKTVEKLVYPLLVLTQAVPKIAVAPLFLVWFGFGIEMTSLMAFVLCVFPVVINTALGLKELNPKYVRLGSIMGGNRMRIFIRMRLPAAASAMFAGFGLAITFATIGAVVGELVAGTQGLGYMANEGAGNLDTTLTFAAVVVLSILGIVLFYLVQAVEYAVVWWNRGR